MRQLKALGLALVAALAVGAVAASGASAEGPGTLTSAFAEPVTLTGEDDGVNTFTSFESSTECPNSTYTGHKVLTHEETTVGETHEFLSSNSTQLTITPHYRQTDAEGTANCDVNGGEFSATIVLNGCDYRVYDFTTTGEVAGTYGFLTDIICPPEKQIEIRSFSAHGHGFQVCTTRIPPQRGLIGGHATNAESEGAHVITLSGTVNSIESSTEGLCGAEETTEGEYHVNVKVKAHEEGGKEEDITLSHTR